MFPERLSWLRFKKWRRLNRRKRKGACQCAQETNEDTNNNNNNNENKDTNNRTSCAHCCLNKSPASAYINASTSAHSGRCSSSASSSPSSLKRTVLSGSRHEQETLSSSNRDPKRGKACLCERSGTSIESPIAQQEGLAGLTSNDLMISTNTSNTRTRTGEPIKGCRATCSSYANQTRGRPKKKVSYSAYVESAGSTDGRHQLDEPVVDNGFSRPHSDSGRDSDVQRSVLCNQHANQPGPGGEKLVQADKQGASAYHDHGPSDVYDYATTNNDEDYDDEDYGAFGRGTMPAASSSPTFDRSTGNVNKRSTGTPVHRGARETGHFVAAGGSHCKALAKQQQQEQRRALGKSPPQEVCSSSFSANVGAGHSMRRAISAFIRRALSPAPVSSQQKQRRAAGHKSDADARSKNVPATRRAEEDKVRFREKGQQNMVTGESTTMPVHTTEAEGSANSGIGLHQYRNNNNNNNDDSSKREEPKSEMSSGLVGQLMTDGTSCDRSAVAHVVNQASRIVSESSSSDATQDDRPRASDIINELGKESAPAASRNNPIISSRTSNDITDSKPRTAHQATISMPAQNQQADQIDQHNKQDRSFKSNLKHVVNEEEDGSDAQQPTNSSVVSRLSSSSELVAENHSIEAQHQIADPEVAIQSPKSSPSSACLNKNKTRTKMGKKNNKQLKAGGKNRTAIAHWPLGKQTISHLALSYHVSRSNKSDNYRNHKYHRDDDNDNSNSTSSTSRTDPQGMISEEDKLAHQAIKRTIRTEATITNQTQMDNLASSRPLNRPASTSTSTASIPSDYSVQASESGKARTNSSIRDDNMATTNWQQSIANDAPVDSANQDYRDGDDLQAQPRQLHLDNVNLDAYNNITCKTPNKQHHKDQQRRGSGARQATLCAPATQSSCSSRLSFGDAEDILTPHLAAYSNFHDNENVHRNGFSDLLSLKSGQFYKHKRPFGRQYEWPTASWIHNTTKPEWVNLDCPKIPASFKATILAASKLRRGSYDDQRGDNDINIILAPSDLQKYEKQKNKFNRDCLSAHRPLKIRRSSSSQISSLSPISSATNKNNNNIYTLTRTKALLFEQQNLLFLNNKTISNNKSTSVQPKLQHQSQKLSNNDENYNPSEDDRYYNNNNNYTYNYNNPLGQLQLAKALLDQDYSLTVQLFIKKSALNWNFNSFTFDAICCGRSLTVLLLHLFDYYSLYNRFQLDITNVLKCFRLLEFGYHGSNPYHNSVHAADVTQAMHCFIQEKRIRMYMTDLEILSSIMAAVCHDLDHPGVNQTFLINTKNPLADLYNGESVLENHHWRFALCVFKESNIFDHFAPDIYNQMTEQIKHLILATDIARQNEYLRRFQEALDSMKPRSNKNIITDRVMEQNCAHPNDEFTLEEPKSRALVLQIALKCADLGNPCRPWLISRVWSNLICDELFKMGRVEKKLGLPLTSICQEEKTSIATIQTDFFRFIVLPLLELWHQFLQSPLSKLLMSNFEHNYQRWQRANRIVQQLKRRKSVASLERIHNSDTDNAQIISLIVMKFYKTK